jgi:hypothetical protein
MIDRRVINPTFQITPEEFDFYNDYDNTSGWLRQMIRYYRWDDVGLAAFYKSVLAKLTREYDKWLLNRLGLTGFYSHWITPDFLLANGWDVVKRSLYDEEGIEGWEWMSPAGNSYVVTGDWGKAPPLPVLG